ncbi:serine hydrolase domain-containing protein [Paenibacillus psychroresistens]|nr:serine hydrolase [Paenibacillus psychroresistens]
MFSLPLRLLLCCLFLILICLVVAPLASDRLPINTPEIVMPVLEPEIVDPIHTVVTTAIPAASTITQQKDSIIDQYLKNENFNGTVLIGSQGNIILKKAYGMANYNKEIVNQIDTKFLVGSITKSFTAMLVMQLEEKGSLNLDDPISKFLPEYPNGNKITIHHLLTHTSGLPYYYSYNYDTPILKVINRIGEIPLLFEPGNRFSYSSPGYLILAYIIEKITGKPYEDVLDENIFQVAGMDNSGYFHRKTPDIKIAIGKNNYGTTMDLGGSIQLTHGSGSLYSTIEDMYLWDRALYTDILVSSETLKKIFKPYVSVNSYDFYGYGWLISDNGKLVSHSGHISGGGIGIISRFIEEDTVIILLSNIEAEDPEMVDRISRKIKLLLS